jgi:hypothetical protein
MGKEPARAPFQSLTPASITTSAKSRGFFSASREEMNLILSLFEIHKGNFQFIVRPLKSDLDGHKPRSLVDDHIDFISQVISPEIEV